MYSEMFIAISESEVSNIVTVIVFHFCILSHTVTIHSLIVRVPAIIQLCWIPLNLSYFLSS